MLKDIELFIAKNVLLRINLDAAGLVLDVDEHALAHVAVRRHTPGEGDFAAFGVIRAGVGALFRGRELVPKRINAAIAQCLQLGLALLD